MQRKARQEAAARSIPGRDGSPQRSQVSAATRRLFSNSACDSPTPPRARELRPRAVARRKRNFTILQQGGLAKLEKSVLEGFNLEVNVWQLYNAFTSPSSRLMSKTARFLSFSQSRRPNDLKCGKIHPQRLRDAVGKRKGGESGNRRPEAGDLNTCQRVLAG
jgi:hypothetical protein